MVKREKKKIFKDISSVMDVDSMAYPKTEMYRIIWKTMPTRPSSSQQSRQSKPKQWAEFRGKKRCDIKSQQSQHLFFAILKTSFIYCMKFH